MTSQMDDSVIVYDKRRGGYFPSTHTVEELASDIDLTGSAPGDVLTAGSNGGYVWTKPKNKFRGSWSPDEILATPNFNDGLVAPWSTSVDAPDGHTPTIVSDSLPSGGLYQNAVKLETVNTALTSKSKLHLDVSGLQNLTRMKFWRRYDPSGGFAWSPRFTVALDDNMLADSAFDDNGTWTQVEVALAPSTDKISFIHRVVTTANAKTTSSRVTGVQIFGTTDPYMLGDFVTHNGKMWESLADNNAQEPSTSAAGWQETLTLASTSGTTANRPASPPAGFAYFDTTLGLPVWFKGPGWVDATGATV